MFTHINGSFNCIAAKYATYCLHHLVTDVINRMQSH